MPSAERYYREKVEEFLEDIRKTRHVKDITIRDYRYILLNELKYLKENGFNYTPMTITKEDIDELVNNRWTGADSYNHGRHSMFFRFLKHFGNSAVRECKPPRSPVARPNADWLTDSEAVAMYNACVTPLERMVVHGELKQGLRKFDLMHLKVEDVYDGYVYVLGKGDKRRSVPFVSDSKEVYAAWWAERKRRMEGVQDPPKELLVYHRGKSVGSYKDTAIDKIVNKVAERAKIGRKIGNHKLRRTCARMWYRAGVPVATISSLLGHSDTKTTLKYLGLVLDDLRSGAQLFDAYFEQAEHEKSRAQSYGKKED